MLTLIATGASNREGATALNISLNTVEDHLTVIYAILGTERRSEVIAFALRSGLGRVW